ncbi:hypothetical protein [Moorena bouillonii]|uniref:Sulfotransferase n=1 Tax=Moorena bouillonii PNG TaxID=568701 RepID=A0A1U7N5L0_9CYAN|nr:hypothetical protein [Moorena bouillonii]OLT61232.1 hypothetical protein BJP37_21640 [Moorena bouillonii PNG]
MTVTLMICFARSGGTILNQCLGSLPNVVIMSEVNPLGGGSGRGNISYKTVQEQAKNWYQIDIKSNQFTEGILELDKKCSSQHHNLIVRDWTFINFVPFKDNKYNPPNRLLSLEALQGKCDLKTFAFVRDSIDVWISRGTPDLESFFNQYITYVETLLEAKIPIFKYENFCEEPNKVILKICSLCDLEYHEVSNNKYQHFYKVNGDIQILSRGQKQGNIKPLKRKLIPKEKIIKLNNCKNMIAANSLLGYPTSYYEAVLENFWFKAIKSNFLNIIKPHNKT